MAGNRGAGARSSVRLRGTESSASMLGQIAADNPRERVVGRPQIRLPAHQTGSARRASMGSAGGGIRLGEEAGRVSPAPRPVFSVSHSRAPSPGSDDTHADLKQALMLPGQRRSNRRASLGSVASYGSAASDARPFPRPAPRALPIRSIAPRPWLPSRPPRAALPPSSPWARRASRSGLISGFVKSANSR